MKYNSKNILKELIVQYENSVLSKQGSSRNIKIKFKFDKKRMANYFAIDGVEYKDKINSEMFYFQQKGWIEVQYDENYDDINFVCLKVEKVNEIYSFLGIKSRLEKENELLNLLYTYKDTELDVYVSDIIDRIKGYKSYQSLIYEDTTLMKDLLVSLSSLFSLEKEMYERTFSVRFLKDSKRFSLLEGKVVSILKNYFNANPNLDNDEILSEYNIVKNPGFILIKGSGKIKIKGSTIDLDDFNNEFLLSTTSIDDISFVELPIKKVITIENLTSFYEMDVDDSLLIYLGGYPNHARRKFVRMLYDYKPESLFYHFGDIDAGGIQIFKVLSESTKVPFIPLGMDVQTIKKYHSQTKPLTNSDRNRLLNLKDDNFFELITYMLDKNVKLEQENVKICF